MKATTRIPEEMTPTEPIQRKSLSAEQQRKLPVESMELSPEQIANGASPTTQIMNVILEEREKRYDVRHWGINE